MRRRCTDTFIHFICSRLPFGNTLEMCLPLPNLCLFSAKFCESKTLIEDMLRLVRYLLLGYLVEHIRGTYVKRSESNVKNLELDFIMSILLSIQYFSSIRLNF